MRINRLNLENLRNHINTEIELEKLNVFYGLNGSGKTSILEAISICSISKSFLPTLDQALVKMGQSGYKVSAKCVTNLDTKYDISIQYNNGKKKEISSNSDDNLNPGDIIGNLPTVVLSPDYKNITFGSPSDRRQFIDKLLSQVSKRYLKELYNLKKSLKNRNAILNDARKGKDFDRGLLEIWTNFFIDTNSHIIKKRHEFLKEFSVDFNNYYSKITNKAEVVEAIYNPDSLPNEEEVLSNSEKIRELLYQRAESLFDSELRRGTTLFGTQKDDLIFKINDGIAKETASQGQHKSLLISIKFAEFDYLNNKKNETPLLLLDDIFSELDAKRTEFVMNLISNSNVQTFITMTDPLLIKKVLPESKDHKYFKLDSGKVLEQK